MKEVGSETGESGREVSHDRGVGIAGVDQDGKADGVVAFEAHLGGVEGGAGVEADIELCERNRREWLAGLAEDKRGYLDEVGVDVKDVGSGVVLRGDDRCADCKMQCGEERERED